MKFKTDPFVLFIIAVIVLAYFFPQWGSNKSAVPLDTIGSIGISLIFFFYGLKLSPDKLVAGLKNWKMHVLIHVSTFLLFPLVVLPFYPLAKIFQEETLWLSVLFLAALPSTVSSSVVMVSIARGNIPAAIFNASISGIIGILITPLWMGLFLKTSTAGFDLGIIYKKLILEIMLPVLAGILLQPFGGKYAVRYSKYLSMFDKSVILLIIYKSFAESFEEKIFSNMQWTHLLLLSVIVTGLFFFIYFLTGAIAKRLQFSIEDRITAQFCGTKKSLIHGTVFSKILFSHTAAIGIILLPLMLFHAFQIFFVSFIATKLGQR